nr:YjcZ family sporulation protein [Neobacillus sp. Marseille-Q6967]
MHYGHHGFDPCCGYGHPAVGGIGFGYGTFVLIVVLFILLIIIGASWC